MTKPRYSTFLGTCLWGLSHAIREMEREDERKKESDWHGLEEEEEDGDEYFNSWWVSNMRRGWGPAFSPAVRRTLFSPAAPTSGLAVRSSVGRTNQHDLHLFVATLGVLIPSLNPGRLLQSELTEAERNDNASEFWVPVCVSGVLWNIKLGDIYMQRHMWVYVCVGVCSHVCL